MSARVAPQPISTAIATLADSRPRTTAGDTRQSAAASGNDAPASPPPEPPAAGRHPDLLPPLPPPPDPPGIMFAAAIMAGALPPRPQTPQEVLLRLGGAWSPPGSDLHLADRKA